MMNNFITFNNFYLNKDSISFIVPIKYKFASNSYRNDWAFRHHTIRYDNLDDQIVAYRIYFKGCEMTDTNSFIVSDNDFEIIKNNLSICK